MHDEPDGAVEKGAQSLDHGGDRGVVAVPTYLGLTLLGAVVGVAGAFVHDLRAPVASLNLPAGLVLALVTGAALTVAGGLVTRTRVGAGLVAGPWVLTALPFAAERPEGDLVISGTPVGYGYLFGAALLAAITVTLPYRDLAPRPEDDAG
jgi:hypothetical protein